MIKTRLGSHFKAWFIKKYIKDEGNKGDFARRLQNDKHFPISKDKSRLLEYVKFNDDKYKVQTDAVILCTEWQLYMECCIAQEIENRLKRTRILYEDIWSKLEDCSLSELSDSNGSAVRVIRDAGCCIIYAEGKSYHIRGSDNEDFPIMSEHGNKLNNVFIDSGVHFASDATSCGNDTLLFRAYFTDVWRISPLNVPNETYIKNIVLKDERGKVLADGFLYKREW